MGHIFWRNEKLWRAKEAILGYPHPEKGAGRIKTSSFVMHYEIVRHFIGVT